MDWTSALRGLRSRFQEASYRYPGIAFRLVHHPGDGTREGLGELLEETGRFPSPSHSMLTVAHGGLRGHKYCGPAEGLSLLDTLADQGGLLLDSAPQRVSSMLSKATLSADVAARGSRVRWYWGVFDYAWAGISPLLAAPRSAWLPGGEAGVATLSYDLLEIKKLIEVNRRSPIRFLPPIPDAWADALPEQYVSDIGDMLAASAQACEVMESLLGEPTDARWSEGMSVAELAHLLRCKGKVPRMKRDVAPAAERLGVIIKSDGRQSHCVRLDSLTPAARRMFSIDHLSKALQAQLKP